MAWSEETKHCNKEDEIGTAFSTFKGPRSTKKLNAMDGGIVKKRGTLNGAYYL